MQLLGVSNPLLSWISSYLSNRKQSVKINGVLSREITVTSGVPQGSHLGPLLFLIFINDLATLLKDCQFLLYADDLKIFRKVTSTNDCLLLQSEINKLTDWCKNNKMELNISKCKII